MSLINQEQAQQIAAALVGDLEVDNDGKYVLTKSFFLSFSNNMEALFRVLSYIPSYKLRGDMSGLFAEQELTAYEQLRIIENLDVSEVTSMSRMFECCRFSGDKSDSDSHSDDDDYILIDLEKWDVSNVTDMSRMFFDSSIVPTYIDRWNISNVTNMALMFYDCNFDEYLKWELRNVENAYDMFGNCKNHVERILVASF